MRNSPFDIEKYLYILTGKRAENKETIPWLQCICFGSVKKECLVWTSIGECHVAHGGAIISLILIIHI